MFGWFKNRLVKRMKNLANVAQLITGMTLLKHYRVGEIADEDDQKVRAARASAIANYFFGKTSDPIHTRGFDLPALYEEGHQWLQQNEPFRELVVQSLRVLSTVEYERSGNATVVGEELLVKFGREFPSSPSPETYEALIEKAIASLAPADQQRVQLWKRTGR